MPDAKLKPIQLREAKANLSAVIDAAKAGESALITRHGKPEAVILSYEQWLKLSRVPSFGELLMSAPEGVEEVERDHSPPRDLDF